MAVESDSSNVLKRPELHRMMEMVAQKLRQMGGTVELVDVGEQEVSAPAMPRLPACSPTPVRGLCRRSLPIGCYFNQRLASQMRW